MGFNSGFKGLNTQTKVYPKVYQNNIYNSLHSTQMGTVTFSYVRHGSFCILQMSLFPMYVLSTELHGHLFCEHTQLRLFQIA